MEPRTLQQWLEHIERLHPQEIALGLDRVQAVRRRLGLEPAFPIVTVGGTNGKGSVCAMLESVLHCAGYRVGCYTSPHLLRYNERVRIARAEATNDELMRAFAAVEHARKGTARGSAEQGPVERGAGARLRDATVKPAEGASPTGPTRVSGAGSPEGAPLPPSDAPHSGGSARGGALTADTSAAESREDPSEAVQLTYFEFGTLAAVWLFVEQRVEIGVLEVGLGGRLDAVNAFDAECAVVSTVDIDHVDFLGGDREAIGREKAGIFRAGRPAVCADPAPPASLTRHASDIGARLLAIGRDFGATPQGKQWQYWGPAGKRGALPYPALRGSGQLANAAAAITALECLRERAPVAVNDIRAGLLQADNPGRFQVMPGRPAVILDVAHNPQAARALAASLEAMGGGGRTLAVFAMLKDKDIGGVIAAVKPQVAHWYFSGLEGARGASAPQLAQAFESASVTAATACDDVAAAYAQACDIAAENDRIVVFGSFFTVAAVMRLRESRRTRSGNGGKRAAVDGAND